MRKVNLVKNPSAEVDTWGTQNASRGTDQAWLGGASYKFSLTNPGAGDPTYMVVGIDLASCNPVVPGQSYQVAFRWRSDRSECKIRCSGLNFMTQAGNDFLTGTTIGGGGDGQLYGGSSVAGTVNVWNTYQRGDYVNSIIAPANAVGARIYISVYLAAAITGTMNVWIDGIHMAPAGSGERIPDYVDGTLGPTYGWDGTPHRSTSYVEVISSAPVISRTRGDLAVRTRLWRSDRYGNMIEPIADRKPYAGEISFNEDTVVKRALTLQVNEPRDFQPFVDWVIPEITIVDVFGVKTKRTFGHYLVTPPSVTSRSGRQSGQIEGKAIEWLLTQSLVGAFTAPAGMDRGAAARALISRLNLNPTQVQIPDTGVLFVEDYTPPPGDTIMTAVTDMLAPAGYYQPWSDAKGVILSRPYRSSVLSASDRVIDTRIHNVLLPEIKETPTWEGRLRNHVIVSREQPDKPTVWGEAWITNPQHPLYHDPDNPDVGFPLELPLSISNNTVETQEQAEAVARTNLADAASMYRKLDLGTIIDLDADGHQLIDLTVAASASKTLYSGIWYRRSWKLVLDGISATMPQELYRTEQFQ